MLIPSLLAAMLLAGCKEPLYTRLSEREANEVLLTLLAGGVDAEKRGDPEAGYGVWAERDELVRAMSLLHANAQPEEVRPSLGDLFSRNQLVSTPAEERVRFLYGLEQSLATTLSKIDGVLVARVHIVLPANDPLAASAKPSSASVFVKHRAGASLEAMVPAIKELVVRGVEGLNVDRVAVALFEAERAAPLTLPPHPPATGLLALIRSTALPAWALAALTGAFVAALLALAYRLGVRNGRSRDDAQGLRRAPRLDDESSLLESRT